MAANSKIEWTDATWNIVTGCSVLSPGCAKCYAMKLAGTRLKHHRSRAGLTIDTKAGPVWSGDVRFNEEWLQQPLQWRRPRKIFVCAHGDLFHEKVTDDQLDRIFAVMALAPRHIFQVLTKRAARMRAYIEAKVRQAPEWVSLPDGDGKVLLPYEGGWPTNVWLGVSVEDQARADERIPHLLATPAAVRWLSCEPLLGPVDLFAELGLPPVMSPCAIDWVVAGGESGPGARPMHPDWARSLRDQCAAAGVPFHFKQWGEWTPGENVERQRGWVPGAHWFGERWSFEDQDLARTDGHIDDEPDLYRVGKKAAGRLLDGVQHDAHPIDAPPSQGAA